MLQRFIEFYNQTREHWLTLPFLLLIFSGILYNFLFSRYGYIAYGDKLLEKQVIENQINELKKQEASLEEKLGILKSDEEALKKFTRDYFLYKDDVTIIKFLDKEEYSRKEIKKEIDLNFYERLYIISMTLLLSFTTILFWRRHKKYAEESD